MRNPTLKANEALTVCAQSIEILLEIILSNYVKQSFSTFFLFAAPFHRFGTASYNFQENKFVKLVELFRAPKGAGAPRMKTTDLGRIHTRHFCTQYCNKKIKRHCDNLSIQSQRFLCQPR